MDENRNGKLKIKNEVVSIRVHTTPPPPPPPPEYTSPFKTLEEWLNYLCETNQPEKNITEYNFSVYGSIQAGIKFLCLIGINRYYPEPDVTEERIEFKPARHMFFTLPEVYADLSQQQLRQRLANELKEFTKSTKFHGSFLSKAKVITNNYEDTIWSR